MICRFVTTVISLTALSFLPGDASAQRRISPADIPPIKLDTAAITNAAPVGSPDFIKTILLAPSSATLLRQALAKAGPEWAPGGRVARALQKLSADVAEAIVQRMPAATGAAKGFLPLAWGRSDELARGVFALNKSSQSWRGWPTMTGFATRSGVAASVIASGRDETPETATVFAEMEQVADGYVLNERTEMTIIYDKRRVGVRMYKRTTIEKTQEPSAVPAFVDAGTLYPGTGQRKVDRSGPSRLNTSSAERVTSTTVNEATVDRCPDVSGLSRGQTVSRRTDAVKGTISATAEVLAQGTVVGNVDDAASLSGYDVDVKTDYKEQVPATGTDIRIETSFNYGKKTRSKNFRFGKQAPFAAEGTGDLTDGKATGTLIGELQIAAIPHLNWAFDIAEKWWQGQNCLELVIASGAAPSELEKGETRQIVVEGRHLEEPAPPKIPVTGEAASGTLASKGPRSAPGATFALTSTSAEGGGAATFRSVSKRGIARPASVSFDENPAGVIRVVWTFQGVVGERGWCPKGTGDGVMSMTGTLRYVRGAGEVVSHYEGVGRVKSDISHCRGLPPTNEREDIECAVRAKTEHDVKVRMEITLVDIGAYKILVDWNPVKNQSYISGRLVDVSVSGDCNPPRNSPRFISDLDWITEDYSRGDVSIETPLGSQIAPGGVPRQGAFTYNEPDPDDSGRWTLMLDNRIRK